MWNLMYAAPRKRGETKGSLGETPRIQTCIYTIYIYIDVCIYGGVYASYFCHKSHITVIRDPMNGRLRRARVSVSAKLERPMRETRQLTFINALVFFSSSSWNDADVYLCARPVRERLSFCRTQSRFFNSIFLFVCTAIFLPLLTYVSSIFSSLRVE